MCCRMEKGEILEGKIEDELEAKKSTIKRILTKKLKTEPSNKIINKLEKLTISELEDIEDRIFEIEDWEEIFDK